MDDDDDDDDDGKPTKQSKMNKLFFYKKKINPTISHDLNSVAFFNDVYFYYVCFGE